MASRYTFVDYSPEWPRAFAREAERVAKLLGGTVVTVHHIGSTAVPGLAAKPIIDLLPVVRDIAEVAARVSAFEAAGYVAWGEYGLPGRRFFSKDRDGWRTHNVHVYAAGHPDIVRHLAFGAYLRAHPAVRDEYAAVKRAAFARHPDDVAAYNADKDAWIKRVERLAAEWAAIDAA